ncbi:MAG: hypothetical protein JST54_09650 [Deltaproteobacteria bacterium]|nr:hypothetical protein [Deltaproteobacteria bacterium]
MPDSPSEPDEEQKLEALRRAFGRGDARTVRRDGEALLATPLSPEGEAEVRELLHRTALDPFTSGVVLVMALVISAIIFALALRS